MHALVNSHRLHYRRDGRGPAVVLVHALGCALALWDPQAQALADRFEIVRYDVRGHGQSDPPAGPFTFDDLASDLRALLDALGIERVHLVGSSMGGVIVRLFALQHPDRTASLVLCSTMARLPSDAAGRWRERAQRVLEQGIDAIVEPSLAHWFPPSALEARTDAVQTTRRMLERTSAAGYLAVCNAVPALDFFARHAEIRAPTLVIAGDADPGRGAQDPEALVRAIPGAVLRVIPAVGHFPHLEAPALFNSIVAEFLSREAALR